MSQTLSTLGLPKGIRDEKRAFQPNGGSMPGGRAAVSDRKQRVIQQCLGTYTVTPANWRLVLGKVSRTGYVRVMFAEGDYQLGDGLDIESSGLQLMAMVPGTARLVFDRPGTAARGNIASVSGDDFVLSGFRLKDASGTIHAVSLTGARAVVERCVFEDCYGAARLQGDSHTLRDCVVLNSRQASVVRLHEATNALVIGNRLMDGDFGYTNIDCNSGSTSCSLTGNVSQASSGTITYYTASGTQVAGNAFSLSAL